MAIRFPRDRTAWVLLVTVLSALALAALFFFRAHRDADWRKQADHLASETRFLANLVQAELQAGSYQNLEEKLDEFGAFDSNISKIEVVAENGFVLARYQRDPPAEESIERAEHFDYAYRGRAAVRLEIDTAELSSGLLVLALQLTVTFVLVAGLLIALLYTLLARQREAIALAKRTETLGAGQALLEREVRSRKRTEESLFEAKEHAEVTLQSIGDAVITVDQRGNVTRINSVAEQLTGWESHEAQDRPIREIFLVLDEQTREPLDNAVERVLRDGQTVGRSTHSLLLNRHGQQVAIEQSAAPIRNRAGELTGVVLVFHDVTGARELANQLNWQASHDALTGLVNRREFEHRLAHAVSFAQNHRQNHALLYMDLDQFKVVNDTCGHIAGDELLRQLSNSLARHLRSNDTLARLGGDEFGVLLEACPLDRAVRIADMLRETIENNRFVWEQRSFQIGVSIGIVPIHRESADVHGLMASADMACYAAKESGRNRTHVYRETDNELRQRQGEMMWVSRINQAINDDDRLLLFRQPIVPLNGIGSSMTEILLRYRGDNNELVLPSVFLPAAERYNLMSQLDRWVIEHVLDYLRADVDNGIAGMMSINLSGASLGDLRLLEYIQSELLQDPGVAPRLCFEITETAAIANLARATSFMHEVRALGCRFALDDFGTGLSSLSYLKNLPVDYLKIDGSLIREIVDSKVDHAMVNAITTIGHTLGIQTIAEYVENNAIRQRVTEIGIDFGQGFGIAEPELMFPLANEAAAV